MTQEHYQLMTILKNLVGNAVEAIESTKKSGMIWIREYKKDGNYVFEVADDGPGISEKDLPNIFDRFFRADASRNSAKRGSGLGLAIVKKIILDHGGNIWAKSTPGTGTSIYFTLKVKDDTQ